MCREAGGRLGSLPSAVDNCDGCGKANQDKAFLSYVLDAVGFAFEPEFGQSQCLRP